LLLLLLLLLLEERGQTELRQVGDLLTPLLDLTSFIINILFNYNGCSTECFRVAIGLNRVLSDALPGVAASS